jgi:hypothetical protein
MQLLPLGKWYRRSPFLVTELVHEGLTDFGFERPQQLGDVGMLFSEKGVQVVMTSWEPRRCHGSCPLWLGHAQGVEFLVDPMPDLQQDKPVTLTLNVHTWLHRHTSPTWEPGRRGYWPLS